MIAIETNNLLNSRAKTCHKILTMVSEHAETHGDAAEGIMCLLLATVFATNAYGIPPKELTQSISKTREIVKRAQVFAGKDAGIEAVVFEAGVN